ncbi:MAG TPA: hypothetical protein VFH51_18025, partial [Myxococcota bacterium]|nr:hypothetical protein [Myxococcota bacterium]
GTMAIIARGRAIAQVGHFRMSGFWGWLAWLAVHLAKLAGFSNRLLVIAQWAVTCFLDRHVARPLVLPSKRPAPMGQTQDTVRVAANDVMVR